MPCSSWPEKHRALVADVHTRFLGHGLTIGDPQLDPRPANRDVWYCGLIEPNAPGRQRDPCLLGGPRDRW
jgi:hypothetical protein